MSNKAFFAGLVMDENGNPLETTYLGDEAQYVLDDNGFLRHIDAEVIDRQVLGALQDQILANKDAVEQGLMKMMGSEDIFTKAAIDKSIQNMDQVLTSRHSRRRAADAGDDGLSRGGQLSRRGAAHRSAGRGG